MPRIDANPPPFWAIHDEAKVRLLLERGADINAKTVEGLTLVHQAASMENGLWLLRLLLDKGAKAEVKTLTGTTPLMIAAGRANLEVMRLLIEKKADVNAHNGAGATPLMNAASTGDTRAVRMLLQRGSDAKVNTKLNRTALMNAATAGNEETVKLLLDAGAEANVHDTRGYSALLYAAGSDAMPAGIVRILLEKGADRNAKGDGETAAMLAAKRGDSEVARLLAVPKEEMKRLGAAPPRVGSGDDRSIVESVQRGLTLLEKQSHNFIRIGGCNSCHAQDLPSAAAALARARRIPAPKLIPQLPRHMENDTAERLMDLNAISLSGVVWQLFDSGMNRFPRDGYSDAAVRYIKMMQTPEGNWRVFESRRPPMNSGLYQATALSIYALQHYGREEDKDGTAEAVARARAWLGTAQPSTTQDQAFRPDGSCLVGWKRYVHRESG